MTARNRRPARWAWMLGVLAAVHAQESRAQPAPSPPSATLSVNAFSEASLFVPDPVQAPPARQLEAGLELSRGSAPFLRMRLGGAMRSLGADLLGIVEGGVRGNTSWGLLGDVAVGAGARQQFTAGDLYVVRGGSAERANDLGTTLLVLTVSAGVGYDFRSVTRQPLQVVLVPRVQFMLPQRDQAAVELGLGLRVAWTFHARPARTGPTVTCGPSRDGECASAP